MSRLRRAVPMGDDDVMSPRSTEWRRIVPLILIMAVVAMTIGGISLVVLYETAFEEARARLTETAQSRTRLMEAVARFNQTHNQDYPGGAFKATIDQIRQAHDDFKGFGESGEFVLARRDGEEIAFVLRHRHHDLDQPESVPFHKELGELHLAEPMRRALLGQSGTIIAPDYRGVTVLAAHEPVAVLNLGVVAKIDLTEIQGPFIRAGAVLLVISIVIIGVGAFVFFRVSEPMVQKIMETEVLRKSGEELERAQREIREKAVYLDNILRSALDTAIIATDEIFVIRYFNPTAEKLFGYAPNQVIGHTVMEIHEWEGVALPRFERGIGRIHTDGEHIYQVDKEEDGARKIIESRASGILDEAGDLLGYVLMSKDITERKQAEEALSKSERKYRLLMEFANDAIFVADAQTGVILDANKAGANLLGRPVEEIIGMSQTQLHPPEKAEIYQSLFKEHVNSGSGVVTDIVVLHRDGRHIPVEIRAGVTDLGERKVIQGIFRDVTERKKADDDLRESRARLAKAQEIAHLGHWDWDIAGNTLYWSGEVFRIFGLDSQTFAATYEAFLGAVHPEDRQMVVQAVDTALRDPDTAYIVQHRVVRPDGEQRIVHEQGEITRDNAGKAVRMVGTVHDITELKETEEKLRDLNLNLENRVAQRTRQLEAANKELESFSYSVAHDLRAPINNALGFSKILLEEHLDQLDPDGREHLEWLNGSALQMKKRVGDYLQLARSTRVLFKKQQVDLSALMEKAVRERKTAHPETEPILVEITPDLKVEGDADLLAVVAENLISNALKFTVGTKNGRIVFGGSEVDQGRMEFHVRDNGCGFDPKFSNRLFEPFERLHEPEEFEGSGIGLTTVQRIIHRHGGTIRAESAPGEGAVFYFTLGKRFKEP
ncbi:MAG: PAS domain S-box protein [Magnetococcales bacterium]|nr:PAS domain S-box protein [Magnetococcales bacterium]